MTKYLAPAPKFQALDSTGAPISGAKVFTYESGASSVPLTTYTDATGNTSNTNPVVLDARGEADIWFTPGVLYRVVLKNAAETTTYWTVDNVAGSVTPSVYFATLMGLTSQSQLFTAVVGPGGTITGSIVMSGSVIEWAPSVTVASATSTPIGAAASNNITVSGVATITSFDNVTAGRIRAVTFSGILTLTHNASSLILPGAANITTAAGDVAVMQSLGSGNWKCLVYQKADGTAVAGGATVATQTVMEAATSNTAMVTPLATNWHPGVAKAWVNFTGVGGTVVTASHNITGVTRNGVGDYTITLATDMSSAAYACVATCGQGVAGTGAQFCLTPSGADAAAGTYRIQTITLNPSTLTDAAFVSAVFFGDQA